MININLKILFLSKWFVFDWLVYKYDKFINFEMIEKNTLLIDIKKGILNEFWC